jgi:hypothetical protein
VLLEIGEFGGSLNTNFWFVSTRIFSGPVELQSNYPGCARDPQKIEKIDFNMLYLFTIFVSK